ncbi:MAG: recombinase RecA [Acidimicrobiia bacterium]|nr:recombinase RecA [Acidimicrobiia bacterium]
MAQITSKGNTKGGAKGNVAKVTPISGRGGGPDSNGTREKAIGMAVSQIERQFGKGALMKLGDDTFKQEQGVVSTGALSLDLALGIGGLPRGRIVEVYGPESSGKTSLALHVIAEAQRNGGVCAFIDAEHALDPVYSRNLGVDIDELYISQPDTGEQALEIADMLIRSGALDVIVIDSVAALVPKAELDGEMGDTHVGLQARLMSQALRKLSGTISKTNTIMIFINQLREKVGVLFGCFDYSTRVTLADGTQEKIGKIVNQKLPVEVLSYDADKDAVVPKRVVGWFDNGRTDEFYRFSVARGGGNGRAQFSCTANHRIRTPRGWKEAQALSVGDRVLQEVPEHLSDFQREVILGSLMGDGALSPTRSGHGARFRWGHGKKQTEYAEWKASLFANIGTSRSTNAEAAIFFDMRPLPELAELRRSVYVGGKKVFSDEYLKALTPLALALWYMDDGTFQLRTEGKQARTAGGSGRCEICIEAMDPATRRRLVDLLADTWGIQAKLVYRGESRKAVLQFPKAATEAFHALIAPFVHPSMDYKLLPKFRGRFAVQPIFTPMRRVLVPMPITDIRVGPPNGKHTHRFDLEVEGTHNYFVDGVMVHNSPETTSGGRALKFYSSVRLDVRRIDSIKVGTEAVGNRVRVKVAKNKCVAAGTRVFDPTTGLTHRIEDIVTGEQGEAVVAADKAGKLHVRRIVNRFAQGVRDVIGLRLRDGTVLRVTPDHKILTDKGWCPAGDLRAGDRIARPRSLGEFGDTEPVPPAHARLLGYLIGDGYVGGKTPVTFINVAESLQQDAIEIAESLGCSARRRGIETSFSFRSGRESELLALVRWAGIWGHLAPEKRIPPDFFASDVSAEVLGNLLFGLWETDGYVSREQTGGIRCGFVTTSEQLAHQVHWLLLRFDIWTSVRVYDPTSQRPSLIKGRVVQARRPCWEVRLSGIDNVTRFAEALPMWGPRGTKLVESLADPELRKHRGSQTNYLPASQTEPVLAYLRGRGLTPSFVGRLLGAGAGAGDSLRLVLGARRLRRDRIERLADALDSEFLRAVLDEDLHYARIEAVLPSERCEVFDIEVDEHHTFVAEGCVVANCSAPFRQAEFDIMYGKGISREGSLLDVAVDAGLVQKSGAWFTYEGEQLGQGRENAKAFLAENPDIALELTERVREVFSPDPVDTADTSEAGDADLLADLEVAGVPAEPAADPE